jgi:ketosteroid isomerase-like protein
MKLFAFLILFPCQVIFSQSIKEQKVIENILKTQVDLWNKGDIPGFMEYYDHSEDLKFIGKNGVTSGWKATLQRYLTTYPDQETMGNLTFDIKEIDVTAGKTAWILGKWQLARPQKGDIGGYFTILMKKIKGRWLIVRDHTS